MTDTASYRLPPPGAAEGLEGYRVVDASGETVGEVAALNRGAGGLVLLVELDAEPGVLVPLAAGHVAVLDDRHQAVVLGEAGAAALEVAPRLPRADVAVDGRTLVRFLPAELLLLVPPGLEADDPMTRWLVALVLGALGGVGLFAAHLVIAAAGGGVAWALMAVPAALLVASGAAVLSGIDAPLAYKLRLVPASLLGYTPRESRRKKS